MRKADKISPREEVKRYLDRFYVSSVGLIAASIIAALTWRVTPVVAVPLWIVTALLLICSTVSMSWTKADLEKNGNRVPAGDNDRRPWKLTLRILFTVLLLAGCLISALCFHSSGAIVCLCVGIGIILEIYLRLWCSPLYCSMYRYLKSTKEE